jgi:hypothetical protein
VPDREEKIECYKTLIDLHFRNIEISQRRLFELRTAFGAGAGEEVAFNKSLIEDEMWEIHQLEVLIKYLEQPKRSDTQLLRRLVRWGNFGLNRKTE